MSEPKYNLRRTHSEDYMFRVFFTSWSQLLQNVSAMLQPQIMVALCLSICSKHLILWYDRGLAHDNLLGKLYTDRVTERSVIVTRYASVQLESDP